MTIQLHPLRTPRTAITACAWIFTWAISLTAPLHAKPGDIDESFGDHGHAITDVGGYHGAANGVAIQDDGKIVAGGFRLRNPDIGREILLVRYTRDGQPDPTFGNNGIVLSGFAGQYHEIFSVAIDARGRIVCTGSYYVAKLAPAYRTFIARFLSDGTPDKSFGQDGKVLSGEKDQETSATKVQIQDDGKIVTFGTRSITPIDATTAANPTSPRCQVRILRLLEDGTRDPSFGIDGVLHGMPVEDNHATGTLLPDGRIIVPSLLGLQTGEYIVRVACYRPDGTLDPTYGNRRGIFEAEPPMKYGTYMKPVVPLPDGGIATAGSVLGDSNRKSQLLALRLTADGRPAPAFGIRRENPTPPGFALGGKLPVKYPPFIPVMAADRRGRLYLAGTTAVDTPDSAPFTIQTGFLARFTADGQSDTTFGRDGMLTRIHGKFDGDLRNIALQRDGKIILCGRSEQKDGLSRFTLTRIEAAGPQPDVRLGLDEKARRGNDIYSRRDSQTLALTIQPDDAGRDVFITFQNDGPKTDSFLITGNYSPHGFHVTYYRGDKPIILTSGSGRLETGPLAPGETYQIRARIKYDADQAAFHTTLQTYTLTAVSLTDRTARDRATIIARLK